MLRHLTCCARAAPRISFVQFGAVLHCFALQTLEIEGLERCNLRSGLPQGDTATSAPAAAAAAAPGCPPPPPLPPLTHANLRSISLVSTDTLQVGRHTSAAVVNLPAVVLRLPAACHCGHMCLMRLRDMQPPALLTRCVHAAAVPRLSIGPSGQYFHRVQGPRAAAAASPD